MSSRSLQGGDLILNSLTVKHLTVTDMDLSNNIPSESDINCETLTANEIVSSIFDIPTTDYDVTNISNPKQFLG